MLDLAIIIPTYTNLGGARERVAEIRASKYGRADIIVILNGAECSSEFDGLHVVVNEFNLGFGRACNQAVKVTAAKLVLLLNDDCEFSESALDALISRMHLSPKTGICAAWPADRATRTDVDLHSSMLAFAFVLIRREVWVVLDGIDESFFAYWEDTDFVLRAKALGWEALYVSQATVNHERNKTLASQSLSVVTLLPLSSATVFALKHRDLTQAIHQWLRYCRVYYGDHRTRLGGEATKSPKDLLMYQTLTPFDVLIRGLRARIRSRHFAKRRFIDVEFEKSEFLRDYFTQSKGIHE